MLIFRRWVRPAFINIKTLMSYMTGQLSFVPWKNIFPEYKTVCLWKFSNKIRHRVLQYVQISRSHG